MQSLRRPTFAALAVLAAACIRMPTYFTKYPDARDGPIYYRAFTGAIMARFITDIYKEPYVNAPVNNQKYHKSYTLCSPIDINPSWVKDINKCHLFRMAHVSGCREIDGCLAMTFNPAIMKDTDDRNRVLETLSSPCEDLGIFSDGVDKTKFSTSLPGFTMTPGRIWNVLKCSNGGIRAKIAKIDNDMLVARF